MKKLLLSFSLYLLASLNPVSAAIQPLEINTPPNPVTKKVLLIIQDPIINLNGQAKRLHEYAGRNPEHMVPQIYDKLRELSHGYANYVTAESFVVNEFPLAMNGLRHTQDTYFACLQNNSTCKPNELNYAAIFEQFNICEKIEFGIIDEVILYGGDQFGYDELAWKIPNDAVPYAMPTNGWLYQYRTKNLPSCGRSYFVMGYNYFVGLDNALHSFGHRIETATALTVGRGFWDGCAGNSDFDLFTCQQAKVTNKSQIPGCGNIHYPTNGATDYDWSSASLVKHRCYNWANYPYLGSAVYTDNCTAWGCNHQGFIEWWMRALPASFGLTINGNQRNWWSYAVDYDEAIRAPAALPNLKPTQIISIPTIPRTGRSITFDSGIQNLGKTASPNVSVKWTIWKPDGSLFSSSVGTHASVGPLQTVLNGNSQFSIWFSEPGVYTVQYQIDHEGQVFETNKNDNIRKIKIEVQYPELSDL